MSNNRVSKAAVGSAGRAAVRREPPMTFAIYSGPRSLNRPFPPTTVRYTLCPKKTATFLFFYNNSVKRRPISIIGIRSPEETLHQKVINLFTSPEICHRTTLRNAELVFITVCNGDIVKKHLLQAVNVWIKDIKVYGFYCSINFFTLKLCCFPHKKWTQFMFWKFVHKLERENK